MHLLGRSALLAALVGMMCWFIGSVAYAQQADTAFYGPRLIKEQVRIPAKGGSYTVAGMVLRPEGAGPYGAVILNHGVGQESERRIESPELLMAAAAVFARRGYVVVLPLRRGFGATGGEFAEDTGPCSNPDFRKGETAAADDVMAAYEYARSLPYVDGSRMILAGQSAGGMVSIFTAATRQPEGLTAVLAFAAGRGGNPARRPGVPCAMESYAKLLDETGKQIKVPVLFHYAENDQFFGPAASKAWYDRFTAAGANAEYVLNPAFGRDGHYVFSELNGVRYWLPAVERFLGKHNIAFERLDLKDPKQAPLFAYDQLPNVKSGTCREMYRVFLESPGPRAYAVSEDGRCGFAGAVAGAREAALNACAKAANGSCQLYAVDDAVVWERNRAPTTLTAGAKPPAAGATNTAVGSSRKE